MTNVAQMKIVTGTVVMIWLLQLMLWQVWLVVVSPFYDNMKSQYI